MRNWKRWAALLLSVILCVSLLTGCGEKVQEGELAVTVGSEFATLDPIYAEDISSQSILVHLYENLMRVAPDGSGDTAVVSGMAKSVDVDENYDGTVTYTFHLRSARWSDGESVKAGDFVYAWRRLANPKSASPYASLLSVVSGYKEARKAKDMDLLQVTAKNDNTLVVTLNGNYEWFLREVCTSPATMPLRKDVVQKLKEEGKQAAGKQEQALPWWHHPAALVTNGSYVAADYQEGISLQLTANGEHYGDQLGPKSLSFHFAKDAEEAEKLYDEKLVDAVWPLTEEHLTKLAQNQDWHPIPQLSSYAVVYNCQRKLLEDIQIRQALALAIDRNALAAAAGVTAVAAEGLVPPGVICEEHGVFRTENNVLLDNDPEEYASYCQLAQKILNDAGYNSGADLGELEFIYLEQENNALVAQELCRQWETVLGAHVTPVGMDSKELWTALRKGNYALAGVNLMAPGNDAECFLMSWTSDSHDNIAFYENSAYDTLMSIIARAPDGMARMGCLRDAEALLLEDYVVSPLYTEGTDWVLRDNLMGAARDARGWFVFSNVVTRTA